MSAKQFSGASDVISFFANRTGFHGVYYIARIDNRQYFANKYYGVILVW